MECLRIGRMIEQHGELFLRRVYTEREIRYCQARKHAIEHFAGRWAAKEAILKAMGTGWSRGIRWIDIEVRNRIGGSHSRIPVSGWAERVRHPGPEGCGRWRFSGSGPISWNVRGSAR